MILVTLGTQDKPFTRLLDAIQKQIDLGNIKDKVVVQAGHTKYKSKDMELFDLIPMEQFDHLIETCDVLITHGGVGSIVTGLNKQKKIIAASRLSQYGEHVNDHQLQIIDNFHESGYVLKLEDFDKLDEVLLNLETFTPQPFSSNAKNFQSKLIEIIDNM